MDNKKKHNKEILDSSIQIQINRLKFNFKFWVKYLIPFFLLVITAFTIYYTANSVTNLFRFIEYIFSIVDSNQQKIDLLFMWRLFFQSDLKILILDMLIIFGAAFASQMSYLSFQVLSEYIYLKVNVNDSLYLELRKKYLLYLYKKATPWLLIFGIIILVIFFLLIFNRLDYYSNVNNLLKLFWQIMLVLIPTIYIIVWVLYYKVLFKKMNTYDYKYFLYSKAAVKRRLQNYINAFLSMYILIQIFFLSFNYIEKLEYNQTNYVKSDKHYSNFWKTNDYSASEYTKIINIYSPNEVYNKVSIANKFYNTKDLPQKLIKIMYNIIILAFTFEVLFPYLTIFLLFKLEWKEIKKLLLSISTSILIVILYQILSEGVFFGIQWGNIFNYKSLSLYIFTFLVTLIKRDNIFNKE